MKKPEISQAKIGVIPVALFVYRRLEHTRSVVSALMNCKLSEKVHLIVYSDGPKDIGAEIDVNKVREFILTVSAFAKVDVKLQPTNVGLARSITEGVSEVLRIYDHVIVLEDDVVVRDEFLLYMTESLLRYRDHSSVWHISGWSHPISGEGLSDCYFTSVMSCWGWATWRSRWQYYRKDPALLCDSWSQGNINEFNLQGAHDFWRQVKQNKSGKIDTWAIFWFATIFENDGLCLQPTVSLVENIGNDGTGTHCSANNVFNSMSPARTIKSFPDQPVIDLLAQERIKKFYRQFEFSAFARILRRFKSMFAHLLSRIQG